MIRIPSDADIEALWAELDDIEPQDCPECRVLCEPCPDHEPEVEDKQGSGCPVHCRIMVYAN